MKVEKHNSHGLELGITLTKEECKNLIESLKQCNENMIGFALTYACKFEDDNDKWEDAGLTFVVM